mmetsp:Transcript_57669/g.137356  ORF Transcript_57669/g.137356 Transcript_57669/m.137356 type:complete len:203 (+) Transcript_57669:2866-3474(+)
MRQGHLELVLLLNQLRLLLGQVGPLELHHQEQQLIFQSILSHSEVDDGTFGLNLRRVVRVGQLRLHKELEAVVQDDFLVTQLHDPLVATLDGISRYHRHDHGINALAHVLNENWLALVQGHLESAEHLGVAHACDLQAVLGLPVLNPHDALQLRIDDQAPALGVAKDGAVLTTHPVSGQALSCPCGHLGIRGQHGQGIGFRS